MNEAAANIPWLPLPEAVARVARHRGCTPEAAELQIVDKGKGSRIKARGVIEGQSVPLQIVGEGKSGRITVATMKPRDVSCEITNVELLFIDLIAAGLLPAPAERARWSAAKTIAYLVKGVPLPWGAWQGQGASPAEIEQAEIDLGEVIGEGVPGWGRPSPFAPERLLPASDFRPDMIENKAPLPVSVAHQPKVVVRIDGTVGTSPPQRSADYKGPPWSSIEIDSAALRQARPRPAEPEPAPPSTLAVSKPAQSSREGPGSACPPPQEPPTIARLVEAAPVAPATELEPEEPKPEEPEPEEPEPEEPEPEEPEPKGWQAERVLWFLRKYYPEGKTSRKKTYKDLRAEFAADPEVIEQNKRRTRRDPSPEVMSACRRYLGYED